MLAFDDINSHWETDGKNYVITPIDCILYTYSIVMCLYILVMKVSCGITALKSV